jgi:hypothetical protein
MFVDKHTAHTIQVITRNNAGHDGIPVIPTLGTTATIAIVIMAVVVMTIMIMTVIISTSYQQASGNKYSRKKFGNQIIFHRANPTGTA